MFIEHDSSVQRNWHAVLLPEHDNLQSSSQWSLSPGEMWVIRRREEVVLLTLVTLFGCPYD